MAEYINTKTHIIEKNEPVIFDYNEKNFYGREEAILNVAAKIVLNKLKECDLFYGRYDAKHGNEHFMYGVSTVMEAIANYAGDEDFEREFSKNMMVSEECIVDK